MLMTMAMNHRDALISMPDIMRRWHYKATDAGVLRVKYHAVFITPGHRNALTSACRLGSFTLI